MKWRWPFFMKKMLAIICVVALLATGCSAQSGSAQNLSSQSSSANAEQYGKVTAINGKELTLELGTMNAGASGNRSQNGAGSANSKNGTVKSNGKKPSGSAPSGSYPTSGAPRQGGGMREVLTPTGEKKVITISDENIISMQSKGSTSAAKLTDIKVGSILKITMNGTTPTAIEIMQFGRGGRNGSGSSTGSSSK